MDRFPLKVSSLSNQMSRESEKSSFTEYVYILENLLIVKQPL